MGGRNEYHLPCHLLPQHPISDPLVLFFLIQTLGLLLSQDSIKTGSLFEPQIQCRTQASSPIPSSVLFSLSSYPLISHPRLYLQTPNFPSSTPFFLSHSLSSNCTFRSPILSFPIVFTSTAPSPLSPTTTSPLRDSLFPLVLIYNFSSPPVAWVHSPRASLFLTKKIRPRSTRRRSTATRTTITMAHAGNESLSPVSPARRPPCEPCLFWCGWLMLPGASGRIELSSMLDVDTVKERADTRRELSDVS